MLNLVCVQQFCAKREKIEDCSIDCVRCGRRRHSFWNDHVGDLLTHLCETRPRASEIVAIAHKAKAFDLHFTLNRATKHKCNPELITNDIKIKSMKMEHLVFLDSVSFLPCALCKLPEACGLQTTKSWYLHYINTEENLDYIGPMSDISYYRVDEMSGGEREVFLVWYETRKSQLFHNKHVLEIYCQDDVMVLRQACRVFRREFLQIGNFEVFLQSLTIASACKKELRRKYLKSDTIALIPTGGYSCNNKYSNKAIMWLLQMEQTNGVVIKHARYEREYRLPELPHFSVDGYCA